MKVNRRKVSSPVLESSGLPDIEAFTNSKNA